MEKLGWYQTLRVTGRWHGQNLYLLTAAEENKRPNPMQIFNQTKNGLGRRQSLAGVRISAVNDKSVKLYNHGEGPY